MSSTLLFAALEARGTSNTTGFNTVAIAGLDGYARAKATFTPMPVPYVGCAGAVLPQSAHVAAGKVYFADGTGVIRSLAPGGQPSQVTSFPMTSTQQMLSFAVSPDGNQLLASIFALPPKPASADACLVNGSPFGPGTLTLDVYAARAGSGSRLLYHQDLGTFGSAQTGQVLSFIGWDAIGPLATYPTSWATQGGGPIHYWGVPVRVDPTTGKVIKPVSDQSCLVWDIAQSGDFACVDSSGSISVRRPEGSEIWRVQAAANNGFMLVFLSPDEAHVVELGGGVFGQNGSVAQLPKDWQFSGWLDNTTLISWAVLTSFSYVSLATPASSVDMGFKGLFIGTVQA